MNPTIYEVVVRGQLTREEKNYAALFSNTAHLAEQSAAKRMMHQGIDWLIDNNRQQHLRDFFYIQGYAVFKLNDQATALMLKLALL